jgi:uncharacterized protein YkwD
VPILCSAALLFATSVEADVDAAYLDSLEAQIVEQVNLARTQPGRYADLIEQTRSEFQGRFRVREGRLPVRTEEGLPAVDEAIAYLRRQRPLAPLEPSPGMSRAAQDHADDQSRTGETGHEGSDGSEAPQRMARYGRWLERAGENIAYGYGDARETVMQLIIDDGYPSRGHRKNFFTPGFHRIGVGCAPHPRYRRMCTMTLAGGYLEAGEAAARKSSGPVRPDEDAWRFDDLWRAIMQHLDDPPEPAQTQPDSR